MGSHINTAKYLGTNTYVRFRSTNSVNLKPQSINRNWLVASIRLFVSSTDWTADWRYEGGEQVANCYTSGVGCDTDTWRMYRTEDIEW